MRQDFEQFADEFREGIEEDKPVFAPFSAFSDCESAPLPDFPIQALPSELRNYADAVAENLQVSPDMPAVIGLAVAALCVQGRFVVNPKPGWIEPLNLYSATVALPSERKSAVLSAMAFPVYDFEREENEARKPDIEEYTIKKDLLVRRINSMTDKTAKKKGEIDFDDIVEARRELNNLEEVKPLRLISDDTTPEALASLMEKNDGRMAIISAEGGIFDLIAGRYSGSVNLDLFLKAYTGDPFRVDRKGRPSEYIQHPALTMLLMFQPSVLANLMQENEFRGRGFLARFMFSLPKSKVGRRVYRTKPIPNEIKERYKNLVYDLLRAGSSETVQTIHFDDSADALAEDFHREIEPQLVDELEGIGDWAGKLHGSTMRIAALLHCCKYGHCAAEVKIGGSTMESAVSIGRYFANHALATFSQAGMLESQEEKDAKFILRRLMETGKDEISKRDLFNLVKGRLRKVDAMQPGLDELERRSYIRRQKSNTGGRPTEKIRLNPLAQKEQKSQKVLPSLEEQRNCCENDENPQFLTSCFRKCSQ